MNEDPIHVPRGHDSTDCKTTYSSVDGCPPDCDCNCHNDESLPYLVHELRMGRDH